MAKGGMLNYPKFQLGGLANLTLNKGKAMVGVKSNCGMLDEPSDTRPVRPMVYEALR